MQYTKAMVDLIQEARRKAPSEHKPSIKLANPDVLAELAKLHIVSTDHVFKAIVKEIFHLAGDPWPERLAQLEQSQDDEYVTRVYRGKTTLVKKATAPHATESKEASVEKPKRIYRGRVVG